MGKERFIKSAVRTFRSTKDIVRNKPYTAVAGVGTAMASSGLGLGLAGGVGIDHPAVIMSTVALGIHAVAIGVIKLESRSK